MESRMDKIMEGRMVYYEEENETLKASRDKRTERERERHPRHRALKEG